MVHKGLYSYPNMANIFSKNIFWVSILSLMQHFFNRNFRCNACHEVYLQSNVEPFLSGTYLLSTYLPTSEGKKENLNIDKDDKVEETEAWHSYNQRPIYHSMEKPDRYIFHMLLNANGGGRWIVGSEVGVDSAWAYAESWSTSLLTLNEISPSHEWRVYQQEIGWITEKDFQITCLDVTPNFQSQKLDKLGNEQEDIDIHHSKKNENENENSKGLMRNDNKEQQLQTIVGGRRAKTKTQSFDPIKQVDTTMVKDSSVYIVSPTLPFLDGLYTQVGAMIDDKYVYQSAEYYLFAVGCCTWVISQSFEVSLDDIDADADAEKKGSNENDENIKNNVKENEDNPSSNSNTNNVDSGGVYAYIDSDVFHPRDFTTKFGSSSSSNDDNVVWYVAIDGEWVEDPGMTIVTSDPNQCLTQLFNVASDSGYTMNSWEDLDDYPILGELANNCNSVTSTLQNYQRIRNIPKHISQYPINIKEGKYYENLNKYFKLHNGISIPLLGLGTGAEARENIEEMVKEAIHPEIGFRLLDTATAYENEDILGNIIGNLYLEEDEKKIAIHSSFGSQGQESSTLGDYVLHDSIFITTKIWYTELGYDRTLNAVLSSIDRLNVYYLDLVLLHWPRCYPALEWMDCDNNPAAGNTWLQSWRALERLYSEGRVHAIGVSNFDLDYLKELESFASIKPMVVQNWMDPIARPWDVINYCKQNGILFQAYSPLRTLISFMRDYVNLSNEIRNPSGGNANKKVDHETIKYIKTIEGLKILSQKTSKRLKINPPLRMVQVLLIWLLQQEIGVVPRSKTRIHMKQNMETQRYLGLEANDLQAMNEGIFNEGNSVTGTGSTLSKKKNGQSFEGEL